MPNKYLEKLAFEPDKEKYVQVKKDLIDVGTIGVAGAATSALAHKILESGKILKNTTRNAALFGGGLGMLSDYGSVKFIKATDQKEQKQD